MQILKTGIVYDPRMLEHKARRKHPETPHRIKVIIDFLDKNNILTHMKIQYLPSVHRLALENQLALAHPQKYINFCQNLWPKSGHRADITVLDTYFTQKSQDIARLATGCLLEGIDKLMEGKWDNGFAVIRPPGHHSGAKSIINGFCIYNNVAIGANYLLNKWKKQRVAIIDWDVHHGDGTQYIMQKNQDVLFVSLHRHDRGTFYPAGDQGNYINNGINQAKGTKINIPFDFVDQTFNSYNFQAPGDNQYIYAYHRIIEPILKQFNPDVILISSGFDAANGDPLGGFTITPNGYYYLTKMILELKKPTLVALEGGYSLQAIKNSAYAIVKALLREQPPLPYEDYQGNTLKQNHLKDLCSIHSYIHQQLDKIISFHSQFWKCLKHQDLLNYTLKVKANLQKSFSIIEDKSESDGSKSSSQAECKKIEDFDNQTRVEQVQGKSRTEIKTEKPQREKKVKQQSTKEQEEITHQFYFAAGHLQRFKNFSPSNQTIHKWSYEPQIKFFESDFQQKKFAPKYYGKEDNYIIIQNLLYNKKPPITIMDIKISRQSKNPFISEERRQKQKKKEQKTTADKFAFRISGYTTQDFKQGGIMTYSEDEVKKLLHLVVDSTNKSQFTAYIQEMIDCLSQINRKYWGSSIVLIKTKTHSVIRWIDFHYYEQEANQSDNDLLQGLQNLKYFIGSIQQIST